MDIQVGGGIRDMKIIEQYLSIGVTRVIIGTSLFTDLAFVKTACSEFPGRISISMDTFDGIVMING